MHYELFDHQKRIIDDDPKKTGLFLGTGSAKTRTALELARGKTLVICPKTQKEDQNWERENEKWGCGVDLTVISKETFRRDEHILGRFDTVKEYYHDGIPRVTSKGLSHQLLCQELAISGCMNAAILVCP
jgi:hypothetical protein